MTGHRRALVYYRLFGARLQVQFVPESASWTAEEVMCGLQAIMDGYATPASLQIGERLLSWNTGEVTSSTRCPCKLSRPSEEGKATWSCIRSRGQSECCFDVDEAVR